MTESEVQTPIRSAYSFDPSTREYLTVIRLVASADGSFPLPDHAVDFAPGPATERQAYQLNERGDAWFAVPDFRGAMLWAKASCTPTANVLRLGDAMPEGLTCIRPNAIAPGEPACNAWDSGSNSWIRIPDFSRHTVWDKSTAAVCASPAPGDALPSHLTIVAPPRELLAPVWSDERGGWISADAITNAPRESVQ